MDDEFSRALQIALASLARAERFEAEIRRALSAFAPEVVDRVVERLRSRRMLDEGRAARGLATRRSGRRAVGDERLRDELSARGAPEEAIRAALDEAGDESARAAAALAAKFGRVGPAARTRAARFLAGRGFGEEAIEAALPQEVVGPD